MEEVSKQIYVETKYDEVNVGAIVLPNGIICVDVPSYARDARDWAARMHRLSPYPVQYIFLTDVNGDRILNTRWLNAPIVTHQHSAERLRSYDKKYPQAILESLSARNPQRGREINNNLVEYATMSFTEEMAMQKHHDLVILRHAGGPMRGSSWVILPSRKLIFTGDTLMVDLHPHLGAPTATSWIASLEELQSLATTHTLIPGRGDHRLATAAIGHALDYLKRMREKVLAHAASGRPRELLANYASQFIDAYPTIRPKAWTVQAIRLSLGYILDEIKSENLTEEL